MRKSLILIFCILLAISAYSATTNDFREVSYRGETFYTHKDLIASDYVIGVSRTFYGSNEGKVRVVAYVANKRGTGTYKIGLQTRSKSINLDSVRIEGVTRTVRINEFTDYIYPIEFELDQKLKKIELQITYDPTIIGLREEFDIILYNASDSREVERVDPFISGFNFRQKFILTTSQLDNDVIQNMSFPVVINSDNNDFWDNHLFQNFNGIEFADSTETTNVFWDVEDFNVTTRRATFWVLGSETFDADLNGSGFIYYGGADVDNSDATSAYDASAQMIHHLEETDAETILDDTLNGHNESSSNATREPIDSCQIGFCMSFDGINQNIIIPSSGTLNQGFGDFTMSYWVNMRDRDSNQFYVGKFKDGDTKGHKSTFITDTNLMEFQVADQDIATTTVPDQTFFHVVTTRFNDDGNVYIDGALRDSQLLNDSSSNNTIFTMAENGNGNNDFNGFLDEVQYYTRGFSADDARLKWLSQIFEPTLQFVTNQLFQPLVVLQAQEIDNELPAVTIDHPNGGESFDKTTISIVDINFTVQDIDSNSLLVDLNFSTSAVQSTGTVIINDVNTDSATITCEDSDFSNPTICTFAWDISGVPDNNFFILVEITDGVSTDFDASNATFEITTAPPIVNIVHPNGGESFDTTTINFVDINFTIQNGTSNSFLVDINFSTSASEGTGTVIIQDVNTDSATITCEDNDFSDPTLCTFSWNISSVPDGDFFIIMTVMNGGLSSSFEAGDATFEIFTNPQVSGTGECAIDLEISLYLGQYLQINYSGFDDTGTFIDSGSFSVFRDKVLLIEDEPLILVNRDFLSFISPKKINDDPYTIVVRSGNCVTTEIVQAKFS